MSFKWSFFILKMIFINFYVSSTKSINVKPETFIVSTRIETSNVASYSNKGDVNVKTEVSFNLRLVSNNNLTLNGQISFTNIASKVGKNCNDMRRSGIFDITSVDKETGIVQVTFDKSDSSFDESLKMCYREDSQSDWMHQGNSKLTSMKPIYQYQQLKKILIIIKSLLIPFFIILSGLLSALALNLLSLTKSELRMLKNQGTSEEKKYSKVVTPLRRRGNVLFCSLLLINTLVNVVIAILFHDLINYWSILAATLLIFFLGEIFPQTLCSRFGILFGNKLAWLTNIIVFISFPFSFPVSKLLDWMLNDEVPMVYNRDRFQELLAINHHIVETKKNQSFVKSPESLKAWKLSNKTIRDVMLALEDTFMLEYNSVLDEKVIKNIIKKGFSRVPIYKNSKSNVVALLHMNDLELIDPSDLLTLKTVCKFYNRPVNFVFDDTKLDVILEEFKKGQSHMAMVQSINNEGVGDPFYETVGMLTLDDVITHVFQSDQEAPLMNNHLTAESKINFVGGESKIDTLRMSLYNLTCRQDHSNSLSTNQLTATITFLRQFPVFDSSVLTNKILEKLLSQSQIITCQDTIDNEDKDKNKESNIESNKESNKESNIESNKVTSIRSLDHVVVQKDAVMSCFVLVLEGRVLMQIGADNFVFTGKAFDHYGMPVLTNKLGLSHNRHMCTNIIGDQASTDYIPDFKVTPDPHTGVTYLIIDRTDYFSSVQASLLKRINENPHEKSYNNLFKMSQNEATDADFVENASVSQQQKLEQQMQQQQQNLQQQLQLHEQHLQQQDQLQMQQDQLEIQQMQQEQQASYNNSNLFVNPSFIEENNLPSITNSTKPGNVTGPSQTNLRSKTLKDDMDDRFNSEVAYDDDVESCKDGLIKEEE